MAILAQIFSPPFKDFAVTQDSQLMGPASAAIGKALILSGWNTSQIVIPRGFGLSTKIPHHRLPFRPMGFDPAQAVETVDNVMSDFMGYGIAEAVFIIFGKYPGIKTDTALGALHLIHTGTFTTEIKIHRQLLKLTLIKLLSLLNALVSGAPDLRLLLLGNRLYAGGLIHCSIIKTRRAGTMWLYNLFRTL